MHLADYLDVLTQYIPEDEREVWALFIDQLEQADNLTPEQHGRVIELGRRSWIPRRAIQRYIQEEGADREWEELFRYARPTTVLLLTRLLKQPGVVTYDDALATDRAVYALHDAEEQELELLRPEVHARLWQEEQGTIQPYLSRAEQELAQLDQRFQSMKEAGILTSEEEYQAFVEGEMV
ncbi:MAG: hypothetical protein WCV84_04940 [Patescibacteria group bacterium]